MKYSNDEIAAYLQRKRKALDDPNFYGRFCTELVAGATFDFSVSADQDAEVQIVLNAGGVTVFANMMLSEARKVHAALGTAIAERAEEVEYLGCPTA